MIRRISFLDLRTSCKNFIYESLIPFLWRCSKSSYYSNRRSLNCFDEELIKYIQTIVVDIHGKDHNFFLKRLEKYGFKLIKKRKLFGYKDIAMYTLQKAY